MTRLDIQITNVDGHHALVSDGDPLRHSDQKPALLLVGPQIELSEQKTWGSCKERVVNEWW